MMNKFILLGFALSSFTITVSAQSEPLGFGGGPMQLQQKSECVSPQERSRIDSMLQVNIAKLKLEGKLPMDWGEQQNSNFQSRPGAGTYIWPIRIKASEQRFNSVYVVGNFVDLDPNYPNQLEDYNCGTRSYDLVDGYNHAGIDIGLWPFAQRMQEESIAEIIAVASGTIIMKDDGNFDKNCSMSGAGQWNAVYVGTDDGNINWYGHMKFGTLTTKLVGDRVNQGDYLGVVGSSGMSTGPHLHFETHSNNTGNVIDPYEGPCNNELSLWQNQQPYFMATINAVMTQFAPPDFRTCPQLEDINEKKRFEVGDEIYFATYLRDYNANDSIRFIVRDPNNNVFKTWSHINSTNYIASYWYWYYLVDESWMEGNYQVSVVLNNDTVTTNFRIGPDDVGVVDNNANIGLKIYPNPASNYVTLVMDKIEDYKDCSIYIYNNIGQLKDKRQWQNGAKQINITVNYPIGMYYVVVENRNSGQRVVEKLLIE